jgi:catechol 2,3-dioxygenase-like lactoylglutathione lyase family enzyme
MIDHISLPVADFYRARAFYDAALQPLGYGRAMEFEHAGYGGLGYGLAQKPTFWVGAPLAGGPPVTPPPGFHVAFAAPDRASVDAFYAAALAAGGSDNGAPGLRPHYHPNYYAAFVLDPDGYHIEAVCHRPA